MFITSYLMLDILLWPFQILQTPFHASQKDPTGMITAAQLRAARALLGIDQRELAQRSGLSLPTIQRMEASDGVVRGNVDSLNRRPRGTTQMSGRAIAIGSHAEWRC
jgi:hypothetical protein